MVWVSGPAQLANADDALHAGITQDLLRGNLAQAQAQSRFSFQSICQAPVTQATEDARAWFDNFIMVTIPTRTAAGGTSPRDFTVHLDGKIATTAGGKIATVYMHFLPSEREAFSTHARYPYAQFDFQLSSYVTLSDGVTIPAGADVHYIGLSAELDGAGPITTSIRGFYLRETA